MQNRTWFKAYIMFSKYSSSLVLQNFNRVLKPWKRWINKSTSITLIAFRKACSTSQWFFRLQPWCKFRIEFHSALLHPIQLQSISASNRVISSQLKRTYSMSLDAYSSKINPFTPENFNSNYSKLRIHSESIRGRNDSDWNSWIEIDLKLC